MSSEGNQFQEAVCPLLVAVRALSAAPLPCYPSQLGLSSHVAIRLTGWAERQLIKDVFGDNGSARPVVTTTLD